MTTERQVEVLAQSDATRPERPATAPSRLSVDVQQVLDAVESAEPVGIPSLAGVVKGVALAIAQPGPASREVAGLVGELATILRGTDAIGPAPKDKRFADPAWRDNPGYRRLAQGYIALGRSLERMVDELAASGRDWHDVERARFAVNALTSLIAPTNTLPGNPAALKRAFDTAGRSTVRGLRNFLHDVRHNGGMPSQTDRTAFQVGRDLAVSPGAVVYRDEVAEVIHYLPSTPTVRAVPVLVVPPPIGRYYFLDLRPGRSFVEYAVSQGLQVFLISWRNPTKAQADWDLDTYAARVVRAMEVAKEVTGSPHVNPLGFCAGGILLTTVLSHLSATGDDSAPSAAYGVTLLDFDSPAPLGAFSAPRLLELAGRQSQRSGVITARSLGNVFSWMRPDDLVFSYVVRNWLMGEDPPVFDILAWNADGTNLPATLHQQFLDIFRHNTLARGDLTVLGTRVDPSSISVPVFVTGAVNDHLTPWDGCYRTTTLVSGPGTFVLSNAGHIASLVNPPGNPKATYWVGGEPGPDPHAWRAGAEMRSGSWWEEWARWTTERAGDERPAPTSLGSAEHPPLAAAPGDYVLDRAG